MKTSVRGAVAALSMGIAIALAPPSAQAQQYPTKPITILVPAAAGGPTDAVARMIGESMARLLGTQIIIENAGGAGGTIGMSRVAKAAADGYTVAVWHIAQATAPSLYDNLKYNVLEDFDSIGRIADVPMTIVGKGNLEPKSAAELLAWLKANESKVIYAHAGIGSASHLCALMLLSATNLKLQAVSYRGTGPAMTDLLGGVFDVMCDQTTTTTAQIKGGKIKRYAATTKERLNVLPDLPTLREVGLKDFEAVAWHAMWAPKGIPADAQAKLTAALQASLKDPKVIERLAQLGIEPVPQDQATPQALKTHLATEVKKWAPIIQAAGVKAN